MKRFLNVLLIIFPALLSGNDLVAKEGFLPLTFTSGVVSDCQNSLPEKLPIYSPGVKCAMKHQDVIAVVEPIVQQRLAATNYDRIAATEQYIEHYLSCKQACQQSDAEISPIEAYKSFSFQPNKADRRGGPCVSLTFDLLEHLPQEMNAYIVGAKLPVRYQQPFFPKYCHTAILIACPEGYVLLDPSFDLDKAIWLPFSGPSYRYDMGKKGVWEFFIQNDQIVCDIQPVGGKPNHPDPDYLRMYYRTDTFVNPVEASATPMLVRDRRLSFLSRNENGIQLAHINVELDKGHILWDADGVQFAPIAFSDFNVNSFPESFCNKLYTTQDELYKRISLILTHKHVLDSLYGVLKVTSNVS